MKKSVKKAVRWVLGLSLILAITVVIMEILLQIVSLVFPASDVYTQGLNPSSKIMEYDSDLLWKIRPKIDIDFQLLDGDIFNVKTIDLGFESIGFRDDGIDDPVYAIVLGDSFTFSAVNLEDTWVEKLEKKTGKDFVNMGVSAYSTIQSEKIMELYGKALKPKLVVVQFYYNDIEGNQLLSSNTRSIRNWLLWNTETYGIMRYFMYQIFGSPVSSGVTYTDDKFNFTFQPGQLPHKEIIESDFTQKGMAKTRQSLVNIKDLSSSIGAKTVIVIMPSKEQIYGHLIEDKLSSEIDYDYYTRSIERICDDADLICINIVPAFKEAAKDSQLFFPIDSHLNAEGNELAAEEVYNFLEHEGFLNLTN